MDFELSDDQLALQAGARDLLDGRASPARVRATVDRGGGLDRELWEAMAEQGWVALELPEASGGLGLTTVEVAVLLEEVGRHVAPAPYLSTMLALGALLRAEQSELVDRLAAGEIGCAWWTAPGRSQLVATGDRLTGRTGPVPWAPSAAVAVIVAREPDGDALYAVDLAAVGAPPREPAMDLTRELGWLELDGTPAVRLGGPDAVDALLDRGASFTAVEMLGSAGRALDLAVEYAKDRVQFGRPIGSFQAVKHRCADMLVDVEGMRSTAYWAAWCIGAGGGVADRPRKAGARDGDRGTVDADPSVASSTAKIWCSDASKRVMASALQVHGGIGFTWEHDLHFFLKRAQLDQVSFGDAAYHRQRLASLLRTRVEAGQSVI